MKRRILAACALSVSALLAITGCAGGAEAPDAEAETVKIGFIGTITGGAADLGQTSLEGVKIAVEEINKAGGVNGQKFEIIVEDEKMSPAVTVEAMRRLAEKGVKFVTGFSVSSDAIAAIPIAEQYGMVIITSIATSTALVTTEFSENLFPISTNTYMMNAAGAHLAATEWSEVKEWHNLGFDYITGHNSWDEFQMLAAKENPKLNFGKAVFFPLDGGQLGSYITSLVGSNPDSSSTGLNISAFGGGIISFAKQAEPYDLFGKYVRIANVGSTQELSAALAGAGPNITYVHDYFWSAYDNEINKRLIEAWKSRPAVGPKTHGPHAWLYEGYTSTMAFAEAMKQASSNDVEKVLAVLPGMEFESAKGKVKFRAEDHLLVSPVSVMECWGDDDNEIGYSCNKATSVPADQVTPEPKR